MAEYIYSADPIGEGEYSHVLVGELVRCGECKYMTPSGMCDEFADSGIRPSASDFCSYGERRADVPDTNVGDMISRAEAINEIARFKGYLDDDMITRLQIAIKKLPSAEERSR